MVPSRNPNTVVTLGNNERLDGPRAFCPFTGFTGITFRHGTGDAGDDFLFTELQGIGNAD